MRSQTIYDAAVRRSDAFSLTILGRTVSSSGGNVRVYDQPSSNALAGDRLHLNIDPTTTAATVAGSINGAPAAELYLAIVNLSGSPFAGESLPSTLNIMNFPDLKRVDLIFSPGYGAVIGELTNVSVVPLPAAVWALRRRIDRSRSLGSGHRAGSRLHETRRFEFYGMIKQEMDFPYLELKKGTELCGAIRSC